MSLVQGNKATLDTGISIGFIPEITADGLFSLFMIICTGGSTAKVLAHEQSLNINPDDRGPLEGHAREMLFRFMEDKKGNLNVHVFVEMLQSLADVLKSETTSKLEKKILTYPEGSTFYTKIAMRGVRINRSNRYLHRFEAFSEWKRILITMEVTESSLHKVGGPKLAVFSAKDDNSPAHPGIIGYRAADGTPYRIDRIITDTRFDRNVTGG